MRRWPDYCDPDRAGLEGRLRWSEYIFDFSFFDEARSTDTSQTREYVVLRISSRTHAGRRTHTPIDHF